MTKIQEVKKKNTFHDMKMVRNSGFRSFKYHYENQAQSHKNTFTLLICQQVFVNYHLCSKHCFNAEYIIYQGKGGRQSVTEQIN